MPLHRSLASNVANVVYAPPVLAYSFIVVDQHWLGIGLYVIALACGQMLRLFGRFGEWPKVSQVVVIGGGLLIAVGLCLEIYEVLSYWLLLPSGIYIVLAIVGGLALRRLA